MSKITTVNGITGDKNINKERIQVLATQQRTNLAEVNSREARTSSDSYYLDSLNITLHELIMIKIKTVKNIKIKRQSDKWHV